VSDSGGNRLTIVTAANHDYGRCLYQFLLSVERVNDPAYQRTVVFDLGLSAPVRMRLQDRFKEVQWRSPDLAPYPPHVRPEARTCAWKPVVIAEAMKEFGGRILWLDSATLIRRRQTRILSELERASVYALVGKSPLFERCHDETLRLLDCDLSFHDRPERPAGVCAFDTDRPTVRELILRWRDLSLDPRCITPEGPPRRSGVEHKWEQAILGVLLYQFEARAGIALSADEIDISSFRPVPFLSTRNKVRPETPLWMDPFLRARSVVWKGLDRASLRFRDVMATRVDGLDRRMKERFEIRISRGEGAPLTVPCPSSRYFADPFLVARGGLRYVFFEDFDHATNRGRISALPLPGEGPEVDVLPPTPVLERPFHLSFPFLFEHGGELFMLPESHRNRTVDLYQCDRFPDRFRLRRRLLDDVDAADSTLFEDKGTWWLFTSVRDATSGSGRFLSLFHTDDLLEGEFRPHPVTQRRLFADQPNQTGRCAGPWVRSGGALVRPMQLNPDYYGQGLEWRRIVRLDEEEYIEEPVTAPPGLGLPSGVSSHHVSSLGDLVAFDVRTRHP